MSSTLTTLKVLRQDAEGNLIPPADSRDVENSTPTPTVAKSNDAEKPETSSPPLQQQQQQQQQQQKQRSPTTTKLALIPLRSVAFSKNTKQQQLLHQQNPLEAKQFPIVLGRANLSQWWYQSCDCQQYYCRLHCRPVAQNIGSLSKVMIQIDTKGTAHIVGKNPHLVTIITPERGYNNNNNSNSIKSNNNDAKGTADDDNNNDGDKIVESNEDKDDHHQPIVLRPRDILSIGRRDREPWMRFQIVENNASVNPALSQKRNSNHAANAKTLGCGTTTRGIAGEVSTKRASPQATGQAQPTNNNHNNNSNNNHQAPKQPRSPDIAIPTPNISTQQRNGHHDAQLPEWITTTTTTNTGTGKRSKSSSPYHNYGITDTKQQQQHQAMVATLTKAAAAAGAAADADERNKSKKYYRCNSYYNYYNHGNYDADSNAQRRRRRYNNSSFAPYHHGLSSHNSKSVIRSAEDLYHNGSSRRGGRLQGHHNDPQIHLVLQDFETSARLIRAGSRRGRCAMSMTNETIENGECTYGDGGGGGGKTVVMDDEGPPPRKMRRFARTDRNFIGKPRDESSIATPTNTTSVACNDEGKSMGLLSQTYAAALLEVRQNRK